MFFPRPVSSSAAAFILVLSHITTAKEDVLYSQKSLDKRYIDSDGNYNISFYHINDVHAHLDQFSSPGTDCTSPEKGCYGGYARVQTVINETRPTHQDSLFLNVGDEFQGTLFYSFYGGEKIADTLNQMGFDGMTLGNHEFDAGDDKLGAFLENLTFPIISANIISDHPILNATIKPYHIYEQYGLAVIGVTTDTVPSISSPGPGTKFTNAIDAVQSTIHHIRNTTNITRIAAITHIGYEADKALAASTSGLQLIMGGHSHTPLGDFEGAEGPYPTIATNVDGDDVFIVTAYRWGEYLGYIDVTYDPSGKILAYHGAPIHLTNTTAQAPALQAQIDEWRGPFEVFAAQELGTADVELDQTACQRRECLLGDFMADAMLAYRLNQSSGADFALINAGGIRATIDAGAVTRGEVQTSFPFGNAVVEVELGGQEVWDVLEGIVSQKNVGNGREVTSFFQVSRGIVVQYNPDAGVGSRLVAVTVKEQALDLERVYRVVTLDFLASGGDNFFTPTSDFVALDTQEEVLTAYIQSQSPIDIVLEDRIVVTSGSLSTSESPPINPNPGGNDTVGAGAGNFTGGGDGGSGSGSGSGTDFGDDGANGTAAATTSVSATGSSDSGGAASATSSADEVGVSVKMVAAVVLGVFFAVLVLET